MSADDTVCWTSIVPQRPGWYWCRQPSGPLREPCIVEVCHLAPARGEYTLVVWGENWSRVEEMQADWCGPIPEPMEARTDG